MNITFTNISNLFLILTAIVSLIYYKKYKNTPLKYIVYYLWYAVLLEVGANVLRNVLGMYNAWWYNIGINIELVFYLVIFYQYISNKKTKKLILIGGVFYESFFLINYLFLSESWNTYQVFPFTFAGLVLIIAIFMFFLEMFQSDKVLYIGKYLIFWIGLGLLFYNVIPMPLLIGKYFYLEKNYSSSIIVFINGIQYVGNLLMYVSFIYGFIWSSMTYKSS